MRKLIILLVFLFAGNFYAQYNSEFTVTSQPTGNVWTTGNSVVVQLSNNIAGAVTVHLQLFNSSGLAYYRDNMPSLEVQNAVAGDEVTLSFGTLAVGTYTSMTVLLEQNSNTVGTQSGLPGFTVVDYTDNFSVTQKPTGTVGSSGNQVTVRLLNGVGLPTDISIQLFGGPAGFYGSGTAGFSALEIQNINSVGDYTITIPDLPDGIYTSMTVLLQPGGTTTTWGRKENVTSFTVSSTPALSNDATLSALSLSSGTLSPTFASGTTSYTASVANSVSSVTVSATPNDANYTGLTGTGSKSLSVGDNSLDVVVTAEDASTTKTYNIVVRRKSTVATLSDLTIDGNTITGFASGTFSYSLSVPYASSSISVGGTTTHASASITSGNGSNSLSVGNNTVTVTVTAEDGNTQNYVMTVRRWNNVTTLSSLGFTEGSITPSFSSGTTSYSSTVANSVSQINISATASDANATVSGYTTPESINVGDNAITVTVTAEDPSISQNYTLNVRRKSTDATLSDLKVGGSTLSGFSSTTYNYSVSVPYATTSTTVGATANHGSANVSGTGSPSLNVGDNSVTVTVTAEDGNTQDYDVTIRRLNNVTTLSTLSFTEGSISPTFASGTTSYSSTVANSVSQINITATPTDGNASVSGFNTPQSISVNSNTITITVTAEDPSISQNYTLSVLRQLAQTTLASPLGTSDESLQPTFEWSKVTGAENYLLEVNTASGFNGTSIFSSNVGNSTSDPQSHTLSSGTSNNLESGVTYYWRVTAKQSSPTNTATTPVAYSSFTTDDVEILGSPSVSTNSVNVTMPLTLDWGGVSGATKYQLQIDTEDDWDGTYVYDQTITGTSQQLTTSELEYNTLYYWRTTGLAKSSPTQNFTTEIAVPQNVDVSVSPSRDAGISITNPTIVWDYDENDAGVTFDITYTSAGSGSGTYASGLDPNSVSGFSQTGPNSGIYSYSYSGSLTMSYNESYTFTVTAKKTSFTSKTDDTTIKTELNPNAITISSVPSGIAVDTTGVTYSLSYEAEKEASQAIIEVKLNNTTTVYGPAAAATGDITLTNASLTTAGDLANNTSYTLDVIVTNNDYSTNKATESSAAFITKLKIPVYTSTPSTGEPLNPTLAWNDVLGAESYLLQINESSDFTGKFVFNSQVNDDGSAGQQSSTVNSTINPIKDESTYYWRVVAKNTSGNTSLIPANYGTFSTAKFVVNNPTYVVSGNGALDVDVTSPRVGWDADAAADKYYVQISTDNTFNTGMVFDGTITTNYKDLSNLAFNTIHYWRVESQNDNSAKTSTTSSFTTEINTPVNVDIQGTTNNFGYTVSDDVVVVWEYDLNDTGVLFDITYSINDGGPTTGTVISDLNPASPGSGFTYSNQTTHNAATYTWNPAADLLYNEKYTITVTAKKTGFTSKFADTWFVTELKDLNVTQFPASSADRDITGGNLLNMQFAYDEAGDESSAKIELQYRNITDAGSWTSFTNFPKNTVSASANYDQSWATLLYNTEYEWQIIMTNNDNNADITTYNNSNDNDLKTKLDVAALVSLADGSSSPDRTPTLSWTLNANNTDVNYDLLIDWSGGSRGVGGTGGDTTFTDYTSTSFTFTGKQPLGRYSWRITTDDTDLNPFDDVVTNSPSATTFFTYDIVPSLKNPVHTLTGVSALPILEWYDGDVDEYTILIDTDAAFNSGTSGALHEIKVSNTAGAGIDGVYTTDGTTITYKVEESDLDGQLTNGQWYFWKVRYKDPNTVNFDSAPWEFKVDASLSLSLSYPGIAEEVYQYDPLQFQWYLSQVQGSVKYKLQVVDDALIAGSLPTPEEWETLTLAVDEDNLNTTFKSITGLLGANQYHWRVIGYYDDGTTTGSFDDEDRVIKISVTNTFTTKGGNIEAFPSWPVGNPTVYLERPTLYWYTLEYEPSVLYTVYYVQSASSIATLGNDLRLVAGVDSLTATANLFTTFDFDLTSDKSYKWQVKSKYTSDNSIKLSNVVEFVTDDWDAVTAFLPTASYPTDGVDVYTTAPTLWWYVGGEYVNLDFDVRYKETSSSTWIPVNGIDGLYTQLTGLLPGKTYEWQVKSYQSGATGNNSGWTTSETFTVVGGGLTKTVASYPVNTETIYDNEVTVSWYLDGSSMGFDEYYVRLVQSNSNPGNWHTVSNSFDANISNVNQTYHTFTDLEYGETYYWAVAFYDAEADALVSTDYSVGSFKIVGGNSTTITNTTPEDESVVYSSSPTVYWQVNGSGIGIQGYRVEYSETQLFVTGFVDEKISTINSVQLTDLTPGATYYWRVSFTYDDPNGSPVWSSASSATEFSVIAGSNSVTPQVQSPISGVTISDASPTLSWRLPVKSESNLVYEIELANNSNFNDAVKLDDVNSLKMKVASLGSGEYFWRVRSKVAGSKSTSVSAYSKVGSFVVDGVTGIEDGRIELVPSNFALEQNYPNPFNPTTSIRFTLPEAEFVSLKIYDMLGNEIRTVMNSDKSSGTHTAVWDGRDNGGSQVTSGTYIYRLTAGNNVEVRKMLLLK